MLARNHQRWVWIGLATVLATLAWVKLPLMVPTQADENIYYYAGVLIAEGSVPYRDFFFAHPPLQELILAGLFRVFGFSIIAGRMLPLACTLATVTLVFFLVRARVGDIAALLACTLGGFSFGFLQHSTYAHGVGLATVLVLAATLAAQKQSPVVSGILLALALLTRFLAAPAALVLLLLYALRDPGRGARAAIAAGAAVLVPNLLLLLCLGRDYALPVFAYHLAKPTARGDFATLLDVLWRQNYYLLLVAAVAVVVPIAHRVVTRPRPPTDARALLAVLRERAKSPDFLAWLSAATIAAHLVWLGLMPRVFGHYALPLFPYLTILAAWAFTLAHAAFARVRARNEAVRWAALAAAAVLTAVVWLRPTTPGPPTETAEHIWHAQRFGILGDALRGTFHREVELRSASYCPITRYTWNAQQHAFGLAPVIADWIAERTTESDTLVGDSMQAPLIALLSGRRIAGGLVDLNPMRFEANTPDVTTLLRTIDTPALRYVLLYPDPRIGDLYRFPEVRAFLREQFARERRFGPFELYRRLDQ